METSTKHALFQNPVLCTKKEQLEINFLYLWLSKHFAECEASAPRKDLCETLGSRTGHPQMVKVLENAQSVVPAPNTCVAKLKPCHEKVVTTHYCDSTTLDLADFKRLRSWTCDIFFHIVVFKSEWWTGGQGKHSTEQLNVFDVGTAVVKITTQSVHRSMTLECDANMTNL